VVVTQEQGQALLEGGKLLSLKQQLDSLWDQYQSQQVEKEQQLQQTLCQGNTQVKSVEAIRELEAFLAQIKTHLTQEGKRVSQLPASFIGELTMDMFQKIKQEGSSARQELQKSLQQAALSLLEGLKVTGDINKLEEISRIAAKFEKMVTELDDGNYLPPDGRGNSGVDGQH
jgi:hypothetical protein